MASNYVVGYNTIVNFKEPRFLVLTGNEVFLREKIINLVASRKNTTKDCVFVDAHNQQEVLNQVYRQGLHISARNGLVKTVFIYNSTGLDSWDWLVVWFNIVSNVRIVVCDASSALAEKLASRANTRGYVITCASPKDERSQAKFVKLLGEWYGQSLTQINFLLRKNNWKVTECTQLLEKLALLNLALNSDTMNRLGVSHSASEEFLEALKNDNSALAMTIIPRVQHECYADIVSDLSAWLDRLARVKTSQSFMKSVHELAFEVGENRKDVEQLVKQGRKYDFTRISRISLALAFADSEVFQTLRVGVLEVLVSKWY